MREHEPESFPPKRSLVGIFSVKLPFMATEIDMRMGDFLVEESFLGVS